MDNDVSAGRPSWPTAAGGMGVSGQRGARTLKGGGQCTVDEDISAAIAGVPPETFRSTRPRRQAGRPRRYLEIGVLVMIEVGELHETLCVHSNCMSGFGLQPELRASRVYQHEQQTGQVPPWAHSRMCWDSPWLRWAFRRGWSSGRVSA